jgi:hypothetical protein
MVTCNAYTANGRCAREGTHDRGDGRMYCWQHVRHAIFVFLKKAA